MFPREDFKLELETWTREDSYNSGKCSDVTSNLDFEVHRYPTRIME